MTVDPRPTIAWGPRKPPPEGDPEKPPKRKRYWLRFILASILIVGVTAGATATAVLLYLDSIAHALSHNNVYSNKLHRYLAHVEGGAPENILIIGSDKRANLGEERGRSDTTMLLRLNPESDAISVMSIPRDLKVDIPGYGINKFNAAYTFGGPKLTLQMVKELTGLQINHVVNVDFLGFIHAVDAIGCVYTDVDRRYYHSNVGVPPSEQYSEINIQPGYQKLCGTKALEYVRYRHTDTDIVRAARQQAFISDARQGISLQDLVFDQNGLIDIFTKYTTSDINNKETMLQVLKLFLSVRGASVKQVHFPVVLGPSYVYSSPGRIHGAVKEFLAGEGSGPRPPSEGKKKPSGSKAKKSGKPAHKHHHSKPPTNDELEPASESGEQQGQDVARHASHGFPVFYPTRLPAGATYPESNSYEHTHYPRFYYLEDSEGNSHEAYRMVLQFGPEYEIHYFGLQGIQGWSNPPILNNPSETQTIHGREYEIFADGDSVKMIAWHQGDSTYWVSNSLLGDLTNDQMVGLATSAKMIIPKAKPRKVKRRG